MGFDGFIKPLGVKDFNYFFGTQEAVDWYLPLKPYTKLEYEWVLENVYLRGHNVIDVGCHQGNYAIILGQGSNLSCIDPFMHNIRMTEHNLSINNLSAALIWGAVSKERGQRKFEYRSNGRLSENGNVVVETYKLSDIDISTNVVKMDIEGAEFEVLPEAIPDMKNCDTWIIEVHPQYGKPEEIVKLFDEFELLYVNRDTLKVEPYQVGIEWKTQATLIARKA